MPERLSDTLYRLRALFGRNHMEQELDEEVRFHFEQQVEKNIQAGMSPTEAARQARLAFGTLDEVKEECRDARGVSFVETAWQDLRYAARRLRNSPGFTAIAVISLALGIGANTAIFSLVDAVLLRSLPVEKPEELELIRRVSGDSGLTLFDHPLYTEFANQTEAFSGVIGRMFQKASFVVDGRPEHGLVEIATGNYFSVLGVQPVLGRFFTEYDDLNPGDHLVAVLSFRFWREEFSEAPDAVGRTIRINDNPYTVIGVAPPGFFGIEVSTSPDAWVPTMQGEQFLTVGDPGRTLFNSPRLQWLNLAGRRAPGVSRAEAEAALNVVYQRVWAADPDRPQRLADLTIDLIPGGKGFSRLRGAFDAPLSILMSLVALVLVLACVNVANLLLGRFAARHNEIGVRLALGSGRLRLARQLFVESLLLGVMGSACGVLLASWGIRLMLGLMPLGSTLSLPATVDLRVLSFSVGVSLLSVAIFGFVPAWRAAAANATDSLRGGKQVSVLSRFDLRKTLVIVQVALALLLVVVGGLFTQSLTNMAAVDLGLNTDNVLTAAVNPRQGGYSPTKNENFFKQLEERLHTTPGVQAVGLSFRTLLQADFDQLGEVESAADAERRTAIVEVDGDFFAAVGTPILRGRALGPQDTATSPKVVVINETAARVHFPGQDPLGQPAPVFKNGGEIIGIARDSKIDNFHDNPVSVIYRNESQNGGVTTAQTLYIRTLGKAAAFAPVLQSIVSELDSNLPLYSVKTFNAQKNEALARERLVAALSGFFAVLSLLLAAIGIYGVVAYSVVARTREIGVRMSLGAERGNVVWMVQRNALQLTLLGVAVGVPLALALFRLLESQLYGIEPNDPATLVAAIGILAAVAVIAALIPAHRASRIDPATVLRSD